MQTRGLQRGVWREGDWEGVGLANHTAKSHDAAGRAKDELLRK